MVKPKASTFKFSVQIWVLLVYSIIYTQCFFVSMYIYTRSIVSLYYIFPLFVRLNIYSLFMSNLFLTYEIYTNGSIPNILDIISLTAILCGIFVIISKNPIVSVLFLIGLFAGISSYLIILGLTFIGLSYLIVYIGAISILFLFILMLINIRISELQANTNNNIILSILIGILFSYPFSQLSYYNLGGASFKNSSNTYIDNLRQKINLNIDNSHVLLVTSNTWDGNLAENNHITAIGNIMYTNYSIWLVMASFILLLAMVGAIVITIKPKN